jgi:hypothetical protein
MKTKGIYQQIKENSNVIPYSGTLTLEVLQKALSDICYKPSQERKFILYTGEGGYYIYHWMMLFGDTIKEKIFHHHFKRLEGFMYISLFKKHSPFKIKIKDGRFDFYKGTILIHTIEGVRNQWEQSDALSYPFEVKNKMDLVNNYVQQLKKEYEKL